jgi:hypothetical protein
MIALDILVNDVTGRLTFKPICDKGLIESKMSTFGLILYLYCSTDVPFLLIICMGVIALLLNLNSLLASGYCYYFGGSIMFFVSFVSNCIS